jgi:hypothetical protein
MNTGWIFYVGLSEQLRALVIGGEEQIFPRGRLTGLTITESLIFFVKIRMTCRRFELLPTIALQQRFSHTLASLIIFLRVQCLFIDELCSPNSLSLSPTPEFSKDLLWWHQRAGVQQDAEDHEMYVQNPSVHVYNAFMNTALRGMLQFWPGSGADPEIQRRLADSLEDGDFFRSPKNYFVLIEKGVQPQSSDQICILLGSNVPFVVRKVEDHYILISDAYVEGLMYGEAIKLMEQGELVVETINIH